MVETRIIVDGAVCERRFSSPPSMLKVFNTRTARLLLAVVIIVSLTSVAASRVLYETSIEAVVNAPRIDVEAPTDGVVDSLAVVPGRTVKHGALLVNIRRDEFSRGTETELGNRINILHDRSTTLATQITSLRAIRDSLQARVKDFRSANVAQLRAASSAADARAEERARNLTRVVALRASNGSTAVDAERARSESEIANYEATSARTALDAAVHGVVTSQGAQDVPYSQQRVDELAVQITNLIAEFTLVTAELRGAEEITVEGASDSMQVGTIQLRANVDGVVWSASHSPGAHVSKGTSLVTLIDCSKLYLDATVSPRQQDKIQPGAVVRLRFAGTSREFPGKVDYVRGGGVREDGTSAAQLTLENRRNDSHAIIAVDEKAIGALPGNFCQVGRSAKVIFDGPDFAQEIERSASLTARVRSLLQR